MTRQVVGGKRSAGLVGVWLAILCAGSATWADDVSFSTTFSPDAVSWHRDTRGDHVYVAGCTLRTRVAGKPDLPARLVRLIVPRALHVTDVAVMHAEFVPLERGAVEFHVPPARDEAGADPACAPDQEVYGTDAPFPFGPVELVGDEHCFGYHIVTVLIHPLRYCPISCELQLLHALEFELLGVECPDERPLAARRSANSAARVRQTIAGLVENDRRITAWAPPTRVERIGPRHGAARLTTTVWPSLEGLPVDYVIVTSEDLAASFEPLAQWKRRKGLSAVVRTVDEIVTRYPGVDTQERIRNFLIEAGELWGTPWVLLGGDTNQVPDRRALWDSITESWGPTDLYFATADGNWNANGNAVFGEIGDDADEGFDFHVGRAPTENASEADVFVQKVLAYEQGPPPDFVSSALLMGATFECAGEGNDHWGQTCAETIAGDILAACPAFSVWRLYNVLSDGETFWGDELLTHVTAQAHLDTGYHLVNHCDHGGIYTMGTGRRCDGGRLEVADALLLANDARQGILFSCGGCSPNAFDYDSISEAFLNNPDGGLVAFIGNTRSGYTSQVSQDIAFFEQLFALEETHLGAAFSIAQSETSVSYLRRALNLLGDPEMSVWTRTPLLPDVSHPLALALGPQEVTVVVWDVTHNPAQSLAGARVCLYKENELFAVDTTGPTGSVTLAITCDTPGTVHLTVTAPNWLPYQAELPVGEAPSAHLYVSGFDIDDADGGLTDGNQDGNPDAGETLALPLQITNGGSAAASAVSAHLVSLTSGISVLLADVFVGDIDIGQTITSDAFVVQLDALLPAETLARFQVELTIPGRDDVQVDTFWFTVHAPELGINGSVLIDDGTGQSQGDGDGLADPGETVEIYVELGNAGHGSARSVSAAVSSNAPGLIVLDDATTFGDIPTLQAALALDPIVVQLGPELQGDETLQLDVSDHYGPRAVFTVDMVAPPAPTNLTFESGPDFIELRWLPVDVPDLLGYHVCRSESALGPFERANTLVQRGASFYRDELDGGGSDDAVYYYYATAVDQGGNESPPSETLMAWPTAPLQTGWPIKLGGQIRGAVALADVDNDGTLEIFVGGQDGKVYAFHHNGLELFDLDDDPLTVSGFAETDGGAGVWGPVAIADLDRDGCLDVIATSRGDEHKIYAWSTCDQDQDGTPDPVAGWPVYLGANAGTSRSAPAVADVDLDGWLEVVFTVETGGGLIHVIDARGFEETGWPKTGLGDDTCATPALASLDLDGYLEIIVGGRDGNIYVWDYQGNLWPGWPVTTGGPISSSAALGDLDGDGWLEIVLNSHDGHVYALEADGTVVPGWESVFYPPLGADLPSPTLADINGDNLPEVFLSAPYGLAGWSSTGEWLADWPAYLPGQSTRSSPVVADIDADGECEILVGADDDRVYAVEADGALAARWPVSTGAPVVATPTVGDLDNDGDLEVIVGAAGTLYVWDCAPGEVAGEVQWGTFHADRERTGVHDPPLRFGTGDSDADGDVDLWDFADLQHCFGVVGPGGELSPGCTLFDFEPDGAVGFADFLEFETRFTSPNPPASTSVSTGARVRHVTRR